MSIDPRLLQAPGDVPQIYTFVSDIDRRLRMLEGARSVIGEGTISGGTGGMIGSGTITGGNVGSGTITGTNIVAGTITATQIQAGSITATLIAADAINAGHIQAGAVTASEIAANTITAANIQAGAITSTEIAAGTIVASDIQAHSLTANEIAAGTITTTEIAANTITAADIAANTITSTEIAATTITAADIAAGTITATQIATGTITGTLIAGATITGSNLVSGTITATQIGVSSLSAISANLGTITAGTVTGATFQTGVSNPRVGFDSSGLFAYDASGNLSVHISSTSGKIAALGGLGGFNMLPNSRFDDWELIDGDSPAEWQHYDNGGTGGPFTWSQVIDGGPTPDLDSWRLQVTSRTAEKGFRLVQALDWKYSTDYVLSWWFKGNSQPDIGSNIAWTENVWIENPTVSTTVWQRYAKRVRVPASGLKFDPVFIYATATSFDVQIALPQLEEGRVPTGHSPRADEIVANAVAAEQIAPSSIQGGAVGGLVWINQVPNPSGELGTPSVQSFSASNTGAAATAVDTSVWAKVGTHASRYSVTRNDGVGVVARTAIGLSGIPIQANRFFAFRVSCKVASVSAGALDDVSPWVYFYKSDGTASATVALGGVSVLTPSVGVVYDLYGIVQSPADAAFAAVGPVFNMPNAVTATLVADIDAFMLIDIGASFSGPTGGSTVVTQVPAYFDGSTDRPYTVWTSTPHASTTSLFAGYDTPLVRRSIVATDIQASTLTAVEIAANTITAGNIAAGTITAAQIATGTITADRLNVSNMYADAGNIINLTAGQITGVTITGSTLQTSVTGARVLLDAGGFTAYNASNVAQVVIPTAGAASFSGSIDAVGGLTQDAVIASPAAGARKHAWLDSNDSEIGSIFGVTSAYPGVATPRLFASATAPMSYLTLVKAHANLVHFWRLNGPTAPTPDSVTTNPLSLGVSATPVAATGLISGTDGAIKSANDGGMSFNGAPAVTESVTTGLSVEYWVRFSALPGVDTKLMLRSNAFNGSQPEYWKTTYVTATGKLQFSILIGGVARTQTSATTIAIDTTYHVVHTYDGANIRTYINGVADGTATAQTGSIDAQATTLYALGLLRGTSSTENQSKVASTTGQGGFGSGGAWSNTANIVSSNDLWATATVGPLGTSEYLYGGGLGFTIPTGAVITNYAFTLEHHTDASGTFQINFYLRPTYNSTTGQSNAVNGGPIGTLTSDQNVGVGAGAGNWGITLTAAQINNANFGFAVRYVEAVNAGTYLVSVDRIGLSISYYTPITLDEAAVYSAALTQAVITDHYQTGVTGISTSTASVNKSVIGADGSSDYGLKSEGMVQALWGATGTNTVTGGAAAEPLENGTEVFDALNSGTATSYTIPAAGVYIFIVHAELINVNVGAEMIMTLTKGGAAWERLIRDWNGGGAGAGPAGAGFGLATLAAGDVMTCTLSHTDGVAARNIEWRMFVARLRTS